MKKIFTLMIVLMTAAVFAKAQDALPSISLYDINGNKINIADLPKSGKITVLDFWATWCVPCKKELNNIADLYDDWKENYDVQVVAVSIDDSKTKANVKSYADGQGWDYLVLLDANKELQRQLNGQSVPFTVIIDQNGNIIEKTNGYVEGDEYVLEDKLKELAGKK